MSVSRRQVLAGGVLATAGVAVGATGGWLAHGARDHAARRAEVDVAVVGGGVAGTYCAWRLATSGTSARSIALFEASGRVGGRLWSEAVPPVTNQVAELVCMESKSRYRLTARFTGGASRAESGFRYGPRVLNPGITGHKRLHRTPGFRFKYAATRFH